MSYLKTILRKLGRAAEIAIFGSAVYVFGLESLQTINKLFSQPIKNQSRLEEMLELERKKLDIDPTILIESNLDSTTGSFTKLVEKAITLCLLIAAQLQILR